MYVVVWALACAAAPSPAPSPAHPFGIYLNRSLLVRRHIANPTLFPKGKQPSNGGRRRKRSRCSPGRDADEEMESFEDDGGDGGDDNDESMECGECDDE